MVLTASSPVATEAGLTITRGLSDVTVTATTLSPKPPADPGHSVQKAWSLNVTSGSLNGARVGATGTGSPTFYIGTNPNYPIPDTGMWLALATTGSPTLRGAVLGNPPSNPSKLGLAT